MSGIDGASGQPLMGLDAVSKSFRGVRALHEVSVALYPGEVHGVVGDSDAGKSTLINILGGEYEFDSGQLLIGGAPTVLRGPAAALAAGVAIIHQQPLMLPDLGIAENIFRGQQPTGAGPGFDRAEMLRRADSLFARLGVELDPTRRARGLSVADRQMVEAARALSLDARVILMDELTVPLSTVEVDRLIRVVRAFCRDGAAVLFVSGYIAEIFEICQRVTIMRAGRLVRTAMIEDVTVDEVIHLIVGRDLDAIHPRKRPTGADAVLEVEALAREDVFSDVSFQVRSGEIVALAGVGGARCADVARAVFGVDHHDAGQVKVHGRALPNGSGQAAIDARVAFIPEDPMPQGLTTAPGFDKNDAGSALERRYAMYGLVRQARERLLATRWAGRLRSKYSATNKPAISADSPRLLGLATALAQHPSVVIIDEPSLGADKQIRADVHWHLDQLAVDGVAILMVSSDVPEVLGMADRVLVLRAGKLMAELTHAEADEASILRAATGPSLGSEA